MNICTRDNVVTHGHKYLNSYVLLKSVTFSVMFKDRTSLKKERETEPVREKPSSAMGQTGKGESPLLAGFGNIWASSQLGANPIHPLGMISSFSQPSLDGILAGRTHVCHDPQEFMVTSLGTHHSGPNKKHLHTMGVQ